MDNRSFIRKSGGFIYRMVSSVVDPINFLLFVPRFFYFWVDFVKYFNCKRSEKIRWLDLHPVINEKTKLTKIDPQYFYQGVWAFNKIYKSGVSQHVDVGSQTNLVSFLTAITEVKFVDIRPLDVELDNFVSIEGSILELPFENNSIQSISCLHVAEHIGLGRYGDPIDPEGTVKACKELQRVLAPGGSLYFSLPIGTQRVCFNAHRVHSIRQILDYFNDLKLEEIIVIDDKGGYIENPRIENYDNAVYSAGLFHFKK